MRAFAVLDGGGVRGAALAGCLSAAEDLNVDFQGYGGASAGAIVALLAAVRYSGREICDMFAGEISPRAAFRDEGAKLQVLEECQREVVDTITSDASKIKKWYRLNRVMTKGGEIGKALWHDGGLYDGEELTRVLQKRISSNLPGLAADQSDFGELESAGAAKLKIVAANISDGTAAVFSSADGRYGRSAVAAAVASSSYPFIFKPVPTIGGQYLADGGLASNLPAFLFAKEYRETRFPIIAFDLLTDGGRESSCKLPVVCRNLLSTALEASDHLLADAIPGVFTVPVRIPARVSPTDFSISADDIRALFDTGYRSATEALAEFGPLKNSHRAGVDLRKSLWALYGPPARYQPMLWALTAMLRERTSARALRAQVMLPTGRRTRIVAYSFGHRLDVDPDVDLELEEDAGAHGLAVANDKLVAVDVEELRENHTRWRIGEEQASRIPLDRKAAIAIPLSPPPSPGGGRRRPLATLSVDTSTHLHDTGWLSPDRDEEEVNVTEEVYNIMVSWGDLLARVLYPAV